MNRTFWNAVARVAYRLQSGQRAKPAPKPPPLNHLNLIETAYTCSQIAQALRYCQRVKKWQLKYTALVPVRPSVSRLANSPPVWDAQNAYNTHALAAGFAEVWHEIVGLAESELRSKYEGMAAKLAKAKKRETQDEQFAQILRMLAEFEQQCPDLGNTVRKLTAEIKKEHYDRQHDRRVSDALLEAQQSAKSAKFGLALSQYIELLDVLHRDHVADEQQKPFFAQIESEVRALYLAATTNKPTKRKRKTA
ncbi:MAG: hypothetical protein ACR2IE_07380 [Candidatus Sumerlaeaceae bacterium]